MGRRSRTAWTWAEGTPYTHAHTRTARTPPIKPLPSWHGAEARGCRAATGWWRRYPALGNVVRTSSKPQRPGRQGGAGWGRAGQSRAIPPLWLPAEMGPQPRLAPRARPPRGLHPATTVCPAAAEAAAAEAAAAETAAAGSGSGGRLVPADAENFSHAVHLISCRLIPRPGMAGSAGSSAPRKQTRWRRGPPRLGAGSPGGPGGPGGRADKRSVAPPTHLRALPAPPCRSRPAGRLPLP